MSSDGLTVSGSLVSSGGVLTTSTGTSLLAEADGEVLSSNGVRFKNLTTASGIYALGSPLRIEGNLVLNGGGLTTAGHPIMLSGSYTNTAGTFNEGTGAVVLRGMTDRTLQLNEQFYDLHVEDSTENGLVGYWKLDEGSGGSGATTVDSSGNGNTGTLQGMNAYAWTGATTSSVRFTNPYALEFDGTDDYVSVPDSATLDLTQHITVGTWVNLRSWGAGWDTVVSKTTDVASEGWSITRGGASPEIRFYATSAQFANAPFNADSAWHHVLGTYDQQTIKLYIDGALADTSSMTTALQSNDANVEIGQGGTSTYNVDALIDDVRIYNRALSAGEVRNLAGGGYALGNSGTSVLTLGSALTLSGSLKIDSGIVDLRGKRNSFEQKVNMFGGDGELRTSTGLTIFEQGLTISGGILRGSTGVVDVRRNFTQSGGTVIAPAGRGALTVSGSMVLRGDTFTQSGGTVVLNSLIPSSLTPSLPLNNVRIEDPTENGLIGYWKFADGPSAGGSGAVTVD